MHRTYLQTAVALTRLLKPLIGSMLFAILLGILGFLAAILIPVLGAYALVTTAGYGTGIGLDLPGIIILLVVCAVTRGFFRYGEQLCNHYLAFKLLALLRERVFQALRILSPAKMETKEKGNLVTLITSDIELLEVFYAHTISPVAIALGVSLLMTALLALLHPLFALLAGLGYFCIGVFLPLLASRTGKSAGAACRAQSGQLSNYLLDSLRGLREVMQYEQGARRLEGIRKLTRMFGKEQGRLKRIEGWVSAATGAAIMVFSSLILLSGALLLQTATLSVGDVVLGFVAVISSFGPVVALSNLASSLSQTFASANRVLDLLEEEPATPDIEDGCSVPFEGLSCEKVQFGYDGTPVLNDLTLTVEKGKTIGIVGRSGSGKSTLLRLIMRFWDVQKGAVRISGVDVRRINTCDLRVLESFVSQDTQLFNDTIENNIRIGRLNATQEEVVVAAKKASLHDFVMSLPKAYESSAGELGDHLSGGERQRIGLARAFIHDAPLMLLDEPTSNLDSLNEGVILQALRTQTTDKTVLLVSHRLSSMACADEIVSLDSQRSS